MGELAEKAIRLMHSTAEDSDQKDTLREPIDEIDSCPSSDPEEALQNKYPLRMGRYLTQKEREDIRTLCPPTGPDWSNWTLKLESGVVSAVVRKIAANERGE